MKLKKKKETMRSEEKKNYLTRLRHSSKNVQHKRTRLQYKATSKRAVSFQTFSERIASIQLNISHQFDYVDSQSDYSNFYASLQKWKDLNVTAGFASFIDELGGDIKSLAQVVLQKKEILDLILIYIKKKDPLYLQPLLDLLTSLAKDLQSDFYPFFEDIFEVLCDILQVKDADILEWSFTALAHLFKILWRSFCRDIKTIYKLYIPLLDEKQPEHVINFSAESFAFLMRKVTAKKDFLVFVFKDLEINPSQSYGIGKILFEALKGVVGQLHSSTSLFVSIFFSLFSDVNLDSLSTFSALKQTYSEVIHYSNKETLKEFWTMNFSEATKQFSSVSKEVDQSFLKYILKLLGTLLSAKSGIALSDATTFVNFLLEILKKKLSSKISREAFKLAVIFLNSDNVIVSMELVSHLIKTIYNFEDELQAIISVNKELISGRYFDTIVLQEFLKFCHKNVQNGTILILSSIAELCLGKCGYVKSGLNLSSQSIYFLDFTFIMQRNVGLATSVPKCIHDTISMAASDNTFKIDELPHVVNAIICAKHVKLTDSSSTVSYLNDFIEIVITKLQEVSSTDDKLRLSWVLSLCIESSLFLGIDAKGLLNKFVASNLLSKDKDLANVYLFRSFDLILSSLSNFRDCITSDQKIQFYDCFKERLCSPSHDVRILTAHILTLLFPKNAESSSSVFEVILQAECIPFTFDNFREKIRILQELEFGNLNANFEIYANFKLAPVYFLIGNLYMNLQVLWQPCLDLLSSHAKQLKRDIFWNAFHDILYLSYAMLDDTFNNIEIKDDLNFNNTTDVVAKYFTTQSNDNKVDVRNFRNLLWQGMEKFIEVAEAKNRDLVTLFLDHFLKKEFFMYDAEKLKRWDLSKVQDKEASNFAKEVTDEKPVSKKAIGSLCKHLKVFSKFSNPISVSREKELRQIYLELLCHKVEEIQLLALDCLFAYKFKYLMPYKENLLNILSDKDYKQEITLFRVDTEANILKNEHREGFLPILIRILYGKMFKKSKTAVAGGRKNVDIKRTTIIQFLAGIEEQELNIFYDLAFAGFQDIRQMQRSVDISTAIVKIQSGVDITSVISLKRILGAFNLLGTLFSNLGNLMKDTLPTLLYFLLSVASIITKLISEKEKISVPVRNVLKTLKSNAMQKVILFLKKYDKYPWKPEEVDALFNVFVWPQLRDLQSESSTQMTPLFKLIKCFGNNPRYFIFLSKHFPDCTRTESVLHYLFQILEHSKAKKSIIESILDLVHNMLTLEEMEHKSDDEAPVLPIYCTDAIVYKSDSSNINYGSQILTDYLHEILGHFLKKLNSKKAVVNNRDLNTLSRLSELVVDKDKSEALIWLIIPSLKKSLKKEGMLIHFLNCIHNLIPICNNSDKFSLQLAPLFLLSKNTEARQLLQNIYVLIGKKSKVLKEDVDIIAGFNTYNKRKINEFDYDQIAIAMRKFSSRLDSDSMTRDLLVPVLYTLIYFISHQVDMSLCSDSTDLVKDVAKYFGRHSKVEAWNKVLETVILKQIRLGLKNENQTVRREFVVILQAFVSHCSSMDSGLNDLIKLSNDKTPGEDGNFFENICHLQLHKRGRALVRLAKSLDGDWKYLKSSTLFYYILPLARSFLFQEEFAKNSQLVEDAILCIGKISKRLNWPHYEMLLLDYLSILTKKIDFQKQAVKVNVEILNGFHFEVRLDDKVKLSKKKDFNSQKILKALNSNIIPKLKHTLASRSKSDLVHKSVKHDIPEEEVMRIPLAIALVRLLMLLPDVALKTYLPGIFSRLSEFLKSRFPEIRQSARDSLGKIFQFLGPTHMKLFLNEMKAALSKGYQIHVYLYTAHSVLVALADQLKSGDLDSCLPILTKVATTELFGLTAEEKEVEKLVSKIKEAQGTKAYDTLKILAKFVSMNLLVDLVQPFKITLKETHSHKITRKVEECLRHIVLGLVENNSLCVEKLFIFVYGILSENLLQIQVKEAKIEKKPGERPEDSLLIKNPLPRKVIAAKSTAKANSHVMIQFGLNLLHFVLKRDLLDSKNETQLGMIDPFLSKLVNYINSNCSDITITTLRCLTLMLKLKLKSFPEHIKEITASVLMLLNKYGGSGTLRNEHHEMILMAFKVITIIVRDVKWHMIEVDQLRILLTMLEENFNNHFRQSSAFSLLSAILTRKINAPEIPQVISKVKELSITGEESVCLLARQVVLNYLFNYPLNKQLKYFIDFYLAQLDYETERGRISALEVIKAFINGLPRKLFASQGDVIFITLASRLGTESSRQCKQIICDNIKQLFVKAEQDLALKLIKITKIWLEGDVIQQQALASQLFGLLYESKKTAFEESDLDEVYSTFSKHLAKSDQCREDELYDSLVFAMLSALLKIYRHNSELLSGVWGENQMRVWQRIHQCLTFPHSWSRLISLQLFGLLFGHIEPQRVTDALENKSEGFSDINYLTRDSFSVIHSLAKDMISQLGVLEISEDTSQQLIKNIIYLTRVVQNLKRNFNKDEDVNQELTLRWLIKKMRFHVNSEVVNHPKMVVKRTIVFKWFAALCITLDEPNIRNLLKFILSPILREINDPFCNESLRQLSEEVYNLYKNRVTKDVFSVVSLELIKHIREKKDLKKETLKQNLVANPQRAIKRKLKNNEQKVINKKKRIAKLKLGIKT